MHLPPDSPVGFLTRNFEQLDLPFQMLFSSPGLSFCFFSKKREIQKQGQMFSLLFLGEEVRNILVLEEHAEFE